MKNKNWPILKSFLTYSIDHPDQRFWQALCNWAGVVKVVVVNKDGEVDTWYFEGKNK